MRGIIFIISVLCFFIIFTSEVEAFWWGGKKKAEQTPEVGEATPKGKEPEKVTEKKKEPEKKTKELQESTDAKRALKEKKRRQLNNTEWQVEMASLTGKEGRQSDIITFKDNQIVSDGFLRLGFSPTNYTLTVQEDGKIVWETMQTSERGGVAFWRGEIDQNMRTMQGILSHHIDDETTQDYSFSSIGKKAITPSD